MLFRALALVTLGACTLAVHRMITTRAVHRCFSCVFFVSSKAHASQMHSLTQFHVLSKFWLPFGPVTATAER